jgi:hypothetical protein
VPAVPAGGCRRRQLSRLAAAWRRAVAARRRAYHRWQRDVLLRSAPAAGPLLVALHESAGTILY